MCMSIPKIYKIKNTINKKEYVGQTYQSLEKRFSRHVLESKWNPRKKMPIVEAIHKYGAKKFSIHLLELLPIDSTKQMVDDKEVEWGLKLNTLSPNGYNLKLGGGRGICSEETKKKISAGNVGKTITEKTRRKLRISHLGKHLSEEAKRKLSLHFSGRPSSRKSNVAASKKNSKKYTLLSPSNELIEVTNMRQFCLANKLCKSNMSLLVSGKKMGYRGWKLIKDHGFIRNL